MKSVLSPELSDDPLAAVARQFFVTTAVVGAAAALLFGLSAGETGLRIGITLGFVALAAFALAALRWPYRLARHALLVIGMGALALIGLAAAGVGWGLNGPGIGFLTILVLATTCLVGTRAGVVMALCAAAMLLALAAAEQAGTLSGAPALAAAPLARRLAVHLMLVGVGLGGGLLVARVVGDAMRSSAERQARFVGLLGIAAAAYWETDEEHRLTGVWRRSGAGRFERVPVPHQRPWEGDLKHEPDALDEHLRTIAERRPFYDLHVRWLSQAGQVRHERVSGEPRYAAGERFIGYWGVTRDVSDEIETRRRLAETESRYRELLGLMPLAAVIHRDGRVLDTNPAGLALFGYTSLAAMRGQPLRDAFDAADAEAARFVHAAGEAGDGTHRRLTTASHTATLRDGRRVALRVSVAPVDALQPPTLLSLFDDVSELAAAEVALRESQELLTQVVDHASLGIAFTRKQRFVHANQALEQMFGWAPGTLAGSNSRAVWPDDEAYAAMGRQMSSAFDGGQPAEFVREMVRRDGSRFWCRLLAKAVDPKHPVDGGTIWIVEDITERRRVDQALAKARDDAEAASRAKSAFLANTSHEVRTPLNGLIGLAQLARRPGLEAARLRQYLDQIVDSAEMLAAVITDVLDLSRIEAGKLEIVSQPFDLHALLNSLERNYRPLADARALGFALHLDAALPRHVDGDAVRLRQIIGNYLHNALKFTEHGGITLAAAPRRDGGEGMLRFEVGDSGPGIGAELQARLFTAFTQGDASTTRRYGGTGLGLSICRELATLMNGRVGVDSAPGEGSRFWVELPLPAAVPAEPAPPAGEPVSLAGARVLVAEDNPVNMMIAVALLEQWGIEVTQAGDGVQAVAAAERAAAQGRPFDLALLDVQMPLMSGHEAARRLRRTHDAQALPIIALTAAALTSERDLALAAGMTDFLTKPIDVARLREAIAGALEGRKVHP